MDQPCGEIFIVDDDRALRDALSVVLTAAGYQLICFADGAALLAVARSRCPVCILLDVNVSAGTGFDVLKDLRDQDYPAPILLISAQADIAMAVVAVKGGAFDLVRKPVDGSELVGRIRDAVAAFECKRAAVRADAVPFPQRAAGTPLTRRERDVLGLLSAGASNKIAARNLGIGIRTVEYHRANLMKKLGVCDAAGLMRMVHAAEVSAATHGIDETRAARQR